MPRKLKSLFIEKLNEKDKNLLFAIGERLADLYYIDKEWLIENYKNIFNKEDAENWKYAMIGYLFNSRNVKKTTYNLLKENADLLKALKTNFEDESINKNTVYQITLSYFNDNEFLEDKNSLIRRLIDNEKSYQIEEMINYVHSKYRDSKYEEKIIKLWKQLMKKKLCDESTIISKCLFWIENLSKTKKEDLEFIKGKNYKIDSETTLYDLIYIFSNKVEFYPELIAELFLKIVYINVDIIDNSTDSEIKDLIEKLYEKIPNASKETVNKICNILIEKGHKEIDEIYRKYKKVYISDKSKGKYHTKDCQYFNKNYEETTPEKAKKLGYTPCSICNPPE